MKHLILIGLTLTMWACGPSEQDKQIESLHKELIAGHDEVMPLSMQLPKLKEKVLAKVEGMQETSDSVMMARKIAVSLTKANDDMYNWMDNFADVMQTTEDKSSKINLYKRLKEDIGLIDESTHEAMESAKTFIDEE